MKWKTRLKFRKTVLTIMALAVAFSFTPRLNGAVETGGDKHKPKSGSDGTSFTWDVLLKNEYVSPQSTKGKANVNPNHVNEQEFQSSQRIVLDGFQWDGGYQTLSTQQVIDSSCQDSDFQKDQICGGNGGDKAAAARSLDAAAKSLGIPSLALVCFHAASAKPKPQTQGDDSQSNGQVEPLKPQSDQLQKANQAQFCKAKEKYRTMRGAGSNYSGSQNAGNAGQSGQPQKDNDGCETKDQEGPFDAKAWGFAKSMREAIIRTEMEPKLRQAVRSDQKKEYRNVLRFLAVAAKESPEMAKKFSQGMGTSQMKQDTQKFLKDFDECIDKAGKVKEVPVNSNVG